MTETVEDFHRAFFQDICGTADVEGHFMESAFLERFTERLIDAGEFDTFDETHYRAAKGMRVDGYCGDPAESDGVLTLIVSEFSHDPELASLTKTEVGKSFKRLENFFRVSLKQDFHQQLEETSAGFGLAELIFRRRQSLIRVRMFLLSNCRLSSRVEGMEEAEIGGVPVSYNVWDIERLYRLASSGKGKEDIDIDLEEEYGQSLPCLPAHVGDTSYEAYLAVVPGDLLARLYERWGARLLEQNVRCFLQAKGKVNKGIRGTIMNHPEMFFAYNNGITATAESVETISNGALRIKRLRNLQIVNGGQTTASIFATGKRDKADLSGIFVQMKLSVIDPAETMKIVPLISEYANSQNRVNAADFFANHPFHVRMQEFSRRVWAPSPDGAFRQTKWFYERARGQYLDEKSNLTPAKKKQFEQEYPKPQAFNKTDLAKFENSWDAKPHVVSRGAQNNFAEYAKTIGQKWEQDSDQFNERYFQHIVAKAIMFRRLEKLVMAQPWYDGGYRANVVTYTMAKLAKLVGAKGKTLDFDGIWKAQALSPALTEVLVVVAVAVHDVIVNPLAGMRNVTEWAKRDGCWERVQALPVVLPDAFAEELVSSGADRAARKEAKSTQKIDNGIEAQQKVLELGSDFWRNAMQWSLDNKVLSPKERQIMGVAAAVPNKIPSEKQSLVLMDVLGKLREEACPLF